MVLQYEDICLRVDKKRYCKDLKILGREVYDHWWRKEGHRVDVEDLRDILEGKPDVIVIGTGYAGLMEVSDRLRTVLADRNIELFEEVTPDAVEVFNRIQSRAKRIAGAFHLTC